MVRYSRLAACVCMFAIFVSVGCNKSSGNHGGPSNISPQIASPTGPGTVMGTDPAYSTSVILGDSLAFQIMGTDGNGADNLVLSGGVLGGSLSAAQAGFNETFPLIVTGLSPQTLLFTGTAATVGNIVLSFTVDDGRGGNHAITFDVTIIQNPVNTPPQIGMPTGPGIVGGFYPTWMTAIPLATSLAFDVVATDVDPVDTLTLTASVTGGTLTPAQAGFLQVFPITTSGVSAQTLSFTGVTLAAGNIELTFDVDDGRGGTDQITLFVTITATPPAMLDSATFVDLNTDGLLNPGDQLRVTFTQSVFVQGAPLANSAFALTGGATFGTSVVIGGPGANEVTIALLSFASFQPNGVYPIDVGATGLNMVANQLDIIDSASTIAVPQLPAALDIAGELNPRVTSAIYTDNGDCLAGVGDSIVVTFSRPVTVAGGATPETAFQILPGPIALPFGLSPSFSGGTTSVSTLSISLGTNPTLVVNGTFDPLNPGVGPSGIDVGLTANQIVDGSFSVVSALAGTPPGHDVQGAVGNGITSAQLTGNVIRVDFCAAVSITDTLATPDSAFTLPVTGDSFGMPGTSSFVAALPITSALFIEINLGTTPVIMASGTFDPAVLTAGSPSGIDISGSGQVLDAASLAALPSTGGVDIFGGGSGIWTPIPSMLTARVGHTATLLESGEILIAGGLTNQDSTTNTGFRLALDTMEIFNPSTGAYTVTASLVRSRAFHYAIALPGLDNTMGSVANDDYVLIAGGWNSEATANQGPHSEPSLELIIPDPNGDGDTSDLVVNPDGTWVATGIGIPVGMVIDEFAPVNFGPIGPGGATAMIPPGYEMTDFDWAPEVFFAGATGITTGPGTGNNEVLGLGGFGTHVWDASMSPGNEAFYFIQYVNASCNDSRPWIALDADEDGDFWDNDPVAGTSDGVFNGAIGLGAPWTTPYSLTRLFASQTRLAGADNVTGTADDAYVIYGGQGYDMTGQCMAGGQCTSLLGDAEYFENIMTGPLLMGLNDAYPTCGLSCSAPGVGMTDRTSQMQAAGGNPPNQVVLVGGGYTAFSTMNCGKAVEIITPDFVTPTNSTIAFGGMDPLDVRAWNGSASTLETSGNVIVAGGIDFVTGGSTDSTIVIDVAGGGTVTLAPAMSQPRDRHAAVEYPASLGLFPEDRVYVFGGWDRANSTDVFIHENQATVIATISDTAEYFIE
ncbi:MAG: kelch repeat-containing protein [Planctomycetota bacterium]|nr:kelch repeat-containing protein [Planctomycetota bacterium]